MLTRRELGRLALALPAAALAAERGAAALARQGRPDSLINGVQIGTITYSFRSMPDQTAEGILRYTTQAGISAVELMGGPVTDYARRRTGYQPPDAGGGRGRGRGGQRGGRGGSDEARPAPTASWNGVPCEPGQPGSDPVYPDLAVSSAASAGRADPPTPAQAAAAAAERKWRMSLSMDVFRDLRKMYNDAGVSIYAVKDVRQETDEDLEYTFAVAEALGASHVTLELPSGSGAAARLERLGDWGHRKQIDVAYHTHAQGSMTAFDEAFRISPGNTANIDLGHMVAGGNRGGTPMDFLRKYHARTSSVHLKDRTRPENCALNLPWGEGETPIREILQLVRDNGWNIPVTVELEYPIPDGSDAVTEVRRCVDYCRRALTT